jgi:beta-N-acetylhexosaminidase
MRVEGRHRGRRAGNRRLAALLGTGLVALVTGAAVGAGDPASPDPRPDGRTTTAATTATPAPPRPTDDDLETARRLPLPRLAGLAVILRFDGSPEPGYVRRALRDGRVAGVILFRDNLPDAAAARALTRRLQRAAGGQALISTDQEGGRIRNLPWAAPRADQSAIATTAAAGAAARAAARDLRAAGLNVNLAPVADLGRPGTVMRTRAFPGDPAAVARLVGASVRAYRGSGVLPTVKHFPGIGAAGVNTDFAPATIDRPADLIGRADLPPFRAAIAAGVPLVMLSHARYPALDPRAIASQSRPIVTDLLKRRLGFRGVAITDSIQAHAVRDRMGPEEAAVRSVRAGIDLVLTTGAGSHLRVWRALQAEARRDPAFRARLTDAAARVLALRRSVRR